MREAIIYNITEEEESMKREQQEEVEKILAQEEGRIEGGNVVGCRSLYTTQIKRILEHGADMYYTDGHLRISNWTPDPPPKPEAPEPGKVLAFGPFDAVLYKMELRAVKDGCWHHDHVELWCGEHMLGYFHISDKSMDWYPTDDVRGNVNIRFDKDC